MTGRDRIERYLWMLPILLLAFLLRIAYLDAQSLWWDEAFSVTISSMDLQSLLEAVLSDRVHPPLYYLLLRVWLTLGQGEFVVRTLSALLGVLAVASMFPMAALIGEKRLAPMSALALAISPTHIWYSQETRMYSLAVSMTLLSSYFFARLLRKDERATWLGYGITTLLAIYTHLLTFFVILAQMTCLTITRTPYRSVLRKWLLCMVVVAVVSAPWFGAVLLTGGFYRASISWIRPAVPQDLFWTIYNFGLGASTDPRSPVNVLVAAMLVAVLAFVSVQLFRRKIRTRQRKVLSLVWLWLFLPIALTFLISLDWPLPQKRSIYMDRFLIPSLPAFLILASYGMTQIFKRKMILGAVTATVLLVPIASSVYSQFYDQSYQRDDWRRAITDIKVGAQSGDILIVRQHDYVPLYYYDLQEIRWLTVPYLESREEYQTFLDTHLPDSLRSGGRLWAMIVSENADPHRFVQARFGDLLERVRKDELRAWLVANYEVLSEQTYTGVYLASYGTRQDQGSPRDVDGSFVLLTEGCRYPILRHEKDAS